MSVTLAPSSNLTESPMLPQTTILVTTTLQWNSSCDGLNDTELLKQVQTIEEAVYNVMRRNLTNQVQYSFSVLILEHCGALVPDHNPFPLLFARFLQVLQTGILIQLTVAQTCGNCSEMLFNATETTLKSVVQSGSLNQEIVTLSNGTIQSHINAVTNSTFVVVTASPTASPSASMNSIPTSSPSTSLTSENPASAWPVTLVSCFLIYELIFFLINKC